jgi:hypothetical protein
MKDNDDHPAFAAFEVACANIQDAITDLPEWDKCLALTSCLAEYIVVNPEDDHSEFCTGSLQFERLAQVNRILHEAILDLISDDDGPDDKDGEDDPHPSPSAPELLRKLLERRRTRATS